MVVQSRDLVDLVESAEVILYADSRRIVVGNLTRNIKTGEEKVVRRRFLDDCETIFTIRFSGAVKYEVFARHVYSYLKSEMPSIKRLKHERKTKGPLGGNPEQYVLEGSKGNDTRINCLNSGRNDWSEFTVCSNYFDAVHVLVGYAKNSLKLKEVKTRTVISLF